MPGRQRWQTTEQAMEVKRTTEQADGDDHRAGRWGFTSGRWWMVSTEQANGGSRRAGGRWSAPSKQMEEAEQEVEQTKRAAIQASGGCRAGWEEENRAGAVMEVADQASGGDAELVE
ncbi:hypothetical protein Dimus_000569, partial [Dionaea muscipula]